MENLSAIKAEWAGKGVRYCVGAYVDIHGVPKGKVVPMAHFEDFAGGSELYTGYALDGLGQGPNDDEIASLPDLARGIQLPWRKDVAWFPADNTFHGEPYPLNTRVVLKRLLAEAEALGWRFNLGIECEVYFLRYSAERGFEVPNDDDNLAKAAYDTKRFFDSIELLDDVSSAINELGWDLYSLDHEDGHGQFEFDFGYSDALTMCDRYVFFRYMAKAIAAKYGLVATFMPKPFADKTGNGAHFNMSFASLATGENLFKRPKTEDPHGLGLSQLGYHFTGGLLRHGRALCATFAPTVNSYKRLIRRGLMGYYSWAPVFNTYGKNNRTNSIRIPMAGGRVESRNADSSCNPYLAAALALAAGLEGIRDKVDPGAPKVENMYEYSDAQLAERGIQRLPQTLGEAVQAFASDPFIEHVLGAELRREFITYKQAEWDEYHQTVSDWELKRYARLF